MRLRTAPFTSSLVVASTTQQTYRGGFDFPTTTMALAESSMATP